MSYIPGYPKEGSQDPLYVDGTTPIALEANAYNMVYQVDMGNTVEIDLPLLSDVPEYNTVRFMPSYSGTLSIVVSGSDHIKEGVSITTSTTAVNGAPVTLQKLLNVGDSTEYWTVIDRDDTGVITKVNTGSGIATLNGSGVVVVSNEKVTVSSAFSLTVQDGGPAPTGGLIYISARSAGTSFTITSKSGVGDSGVKVFYQIWESLVY